MAREGISEQMISLILSILMYPSPTAVFTKNEMEKYEELLQSVHEGRLMEYTLEFPKHRFLQYVSAKGEYVFHGSNHHHISSFEPREQTLYNNELATAVFATTDLIWSMFFAVLDRGAVIGSFRNGCIKGRHTNYHYYSINESTLQNHPWTDGMLYLLPKEPFEMSGQGHVQFDEWICKEPVVPIGKISVSLDDFYFSDKIAVHRDQESLLSTWIFYKARTLVNQKRIRN